MRLLVALPILILASAQCVAQADPSRQIGTPVTKSMCWDPALIGHAAIEPLNSQLRKLCPEQGIILIEALINQNGQIEKIKYVAGPLVFEIPATLWAKKCFYIPASLSDQSVRENMFIKLRANPTNGSLEFAFHISTSPKIDAWQPVPVK